MKIDQEIQQSIIFDLKFRKTAKTFLAASLFLEILSVFGELDSDVLEKIKYSKFKAAEIMKAIKAGKTPSPGGPMDQVTITPSMQSEPVDQSTVEEEYKVQDHGLDYKTIQQAQKLAKFAISALQYDDVNNAIENLENALFLLKKI